MMYRFILLVLVFAVTSSVLAQSNCTCAELYSLKSKIDNDSLIGAKLIAYSGNTCKAKGYELLGKWQNDLSNYDSAIYFLEKAESFYKKNVCSDTVLLTTYKSLAQAYYSKADFVTAQRYSFKMLDCAEAANNIFESAMSNTMIAQLFNQTNQADRGIVYLRKAVAKLSSINNYSQKKTLLFLISKRYLWHYQDTKTKTSLDSSELFGRLFLDIGTKLKDSSSISKAYSHLQGVAYEWGDFRKALSLLDSSFYFINKENYEDLRVNYYDKADLYLELKDYTAAEKFADSTLYYSNLLENISFTAECYSLIARIAKETGDFKKALEFTNLAQNINDSIRNESKILAVAELEKKYNQSKNENTIIELSKKKQLYFFIAIAGLLTTAIIAFYFRQQSLNHKKNILEVEQRLNRARMNPHFFFNALTTLQKFALRDNNGQALASNLSKFSNIMRETLESTYKEYVTIEQEMEFLNEYLEVQKIRFPEKFSFTITADDRIEIDELLIPSMIIQPFVENSIEHGFVGINHSGFIEISFSLKNQEIIVEIKDNGKGLATEAKESNHVSRASQIIKDRIYLLNIKLKTKAGFSINNNAGNNGVTVKIHLPILYKTNTI